MKLCLIAMGGDGTYREYNYQKTRELGNEGGFILAPPQASLLPYDLDLTRGSNAKYCNIFL